jgi:hypothetical protein
VRSNSICLVHCTGKYFALTREHTDLIKSWHRHGFCCSAEQFTKDGEECRCGFVVYQ